MADIKERLHNALHRGHKKASEEEAAEVAAVALVIMTEVIVELTEVLADFELRLEALEAG